MDNILQSLKDIEKRVSELGNSLEREEKLYSEELKERLKLGLEGQEAIDHYNEFMKRNGMEHLMVKDN